MAGFSDRRPDIAHISIGNAEARSREPRRVGLGSPRNM
jgi:hypothetical protein